MPENVIRIAVDHDASCSRGEYRRGRPLISGLLEHRLCGEACVHVIPDLHHHIIADQSFFGLINILHHTSQFIHPPSKYLLCVAVRIPRVPESSK